MMRRDEPAPGSIRQPGQRHTFGHKWNGLKWSSWAHEQGWRIVPPKRGWAGTLEAVSALGALSLAILKLQRELNAKFGATEDDCSVQETVLYWGSPSRSSSSFISSCNSSVCVLLSQHSVCRKTCAHFSYSEADVFILIYINCMKCKLFLVFSYMVVISLSFFLFCFVSSFCCMRPKQSMKHCVCNSGAYKKHERACEG